MKKIILGILMTAAAGIGGAGVGAMLVALLVLLALLMGVSPITPWFATFFAVIAWGLPTLGAAAGVAVGWYAVMRPVKTRDEYEAQWRMCQRCGYNLTGNTTSRCPECSQRATQRQRRLLAREAR